MFKVLKNYCLSAKQGCGWLPIPMPILKLYNSYNLVRLAKQYVNLQRVIVQKNHETFYICMASCFRGTLIIISVLYCQDASRYIYIYLNICSSATAVDYI